MVFQVRNVLSSRIFQVFHHVKLQGLWKLASGLGKLVHLPQLGLPCPKWWTICQLPQFANCPNLVGGFNPFEKYESNWESSPSRDENKEYSKIPPSYQCLEGMQYAMKAREYFSGKQNQSTINKSPMPIIGVRFSLEGVSNKLMILGCFFSSGAKKIATDSLIHGISLWACQGPVLVNAVEQVTG